MFLIVELHIVNQGSHFLNAVFTKGTGSKVSDTIVKAFQNVLKTTAVCNSASF